MDAGQKLLKMMSKQDVEQTMAWHAQTDALMQLQARQVRRSALMGEKLSGYLSRTDVPGTMALTMVIWLCSLVLVALVVFPLFGAAIAMMVAGGLLVVSLAICWGICTYQVGNGVQN